MYMPNAKTRRQPPNATYIPLEYRLRLLPNAKKSTQKKRNVHGQRKKLASPNARDTNMLVFHALGDAKVLSFALGDAKVPDARYFAFWWNIGLRDLIAGVAIPIGRASYMYNHFPTILIFFCRYIKIHESKSLPDHRQSHGEIVYKGSQHG